MRILITAGPTQEAIDPVRFLSNRSSGKMGYAIAEAAARAGHQVVLVSGPTRLEAPDEVELHPVRTAADMYEAVAKQIGDCDAAIMVAAVADYRPVAVAEQKIKKTSGDGETLSLELERTEDILGSARTKMGFEGTLVGFAAETENLEANARDKLRRKNCDLVVANDVSRFDIGFDSDNNALTLLFADGRREELSDAPKSELAVELLRHIEAIERA